MRSELLSAPEALRVELDRLVEREQAGKRLPSIAAAVVRDGEVVWERAVGAADLEAREDATPETQYRIGSITKTLTAVAVMQLRDEGRLDLDDPLDRFLAGLPHRPTLSRLLSHASGLQRETPGDVWVTLKFLSEEELLRDLGQAEQVLPPGARFHYSNLAFALLGQVVARVSGTPYESCVRERILAPLGMERTTFGPEAPHAQGYLVEPYRDGVRREAPVRTASFVPAGELWSTVRDLCRWASFLGQGNEDVLATRTLEEMRVVRVLDDGERWTSGYGLGLNLVRDGERILVGHGGAMPGFIARVLASPRDRIGAVVLTNNGTARVTPVTKALVAKACELYPLPPEPWTVEEPPPGEIASALGRWWSEGTEVVFAWRRGRLEARDALAEDWEPPSVFEREERDRWRTISGDEHGEQLRLERDGEGRVTRMFWATYLLTREPTTFGGTK